MVETRGTFPGGTAGAGGAPPVVEIRELGIRLGSEFAVVIDRLVLERGEVIVADAVSGTGKSTVLGLVCGAIRAVPTEGTLHRLFGADVRPAAGQPGYGDPTKLGFVFQNNALVPYLTVRENIRLPMDVAGIAPETGWFDHLVGALGLGAVLERKPDQISIGQRQRAAIARAFLGKPELLLLDEPVSALDPANVAQVEALIEVLAEEAGAAVILASHQAHRSVFAGRPRLSHRLEQAGGIPTSVFTDAPRAASMEARAS